jgi:hypothetical protein
MGRVNWRLAGVFVGAMVVTGLLDYVVYNAGYEGIATVIWALGYGTVILGAWFVWFRPLEFDDPSGSTTRTWEVTTRSSGDEETDETPNEDDTDSERAGNSATATDTTEQESSIPPTYREQS